MASNYVNILRKPGAFKFSATGLLARMPMSMVSISSLLAIQSEYHSYTLAGQVSAVTLIAFACTAPWLARRVDIYGQRFMIPFITTSCLAMVGEIVSITRRRCWFAPPLPVVPAVLWAPWCVHAGLTC